MFVSNEKPTKRPMRERGKFTPLRKMKVDGVEQPFVNCLKFVDQILKKNKPTRLQRAKAWLTQFTKTKE
jgi:hypothetical protein